MSSRCTTTCKSHSTHEGDRSDPVPFAVVGHLGQESRRVRTAEVALMGACPGRRFFRTAELAFLEADLPFMRAILAVQSNKGSERASTTATSAVCRRGASRRR